MNEVAGLGNRQGAVQVYMANRPLFPLPGGPHDILPVDIHAISAINRACGNGWRKVFNVYAKWMYAFYDMLGMDINLPDWQSYRDDQLLTAHSDTALWFVPPNALDSTKLNIVMGKTYAKTLPFKNALHWIAPDFALWPASQLIVTPYFDYRQLTNDKIAFLNHLIKAELGITASQLSLHQ